MFVARLIGVGAITLGVIVLKFVRVSAPPGWRRLEGVAGDHGLRRSLDRFLFVRRWIVSLVGLGFIVRGILYVLVPPAHVHGHEVEASVAPEDQSKPELK